MGEKYNHKAFSGEIFLMISLDVLTQNQSVMHR